MKEVVVTERIVLNPIYFAYDKSNITKEVLLNLMLVLCNVKNEDLVIFVKSHTDSWYDKYNLDLPIEELSRL
jgi:outer membrane protein OmpA-like peptidoglycan-associated protein